MPGVATALGSLSTPQKGGGAPAGFEVITALNASGVREPVTALNGRGVREPLWARKAA